jgi:hypothetical protein
LSSKFLLAIRAVLGFPTAAERAGWPLSVTWSARGIKALALSQR